MHRLDYFLLLFEKWKYFMFYVNVKILKYQEIDLIHYSDLLQAQSYCSLSQIFNIIIVCSKILDNLNFRIVQLY